MSDVLFHRLREEDVAATDARQVFACHTERRGQMRLRGVATTRGVRAEGAPHVRLHATSASSVSIALVAVRLLLADK